MLPRHTRVSLSGWCITIWRVSSSHISPVVHIVHVAAGLRMVQLRLGPLAYHVLLLDGLL